VASRIAPAPGCRVVKTPFCGVEHGRERGPGTSGCRSGARAGRIATGLTLQGDVGLNSISLKLDGKPLKTLLAGDYTFCVSDRSATQNFHLKGPGLNKSTGARQVGRLSFTTKLAKGTYQYFSDAKSSLKGSFTVS